MNAELKKKLIKSLNWCGSSLAIMGIIFVGLHLRDYGLQLDTSRLTNKDIFIIIGLTLFYGVACIIPCLSWKKVISALGGDISTNKAVYIYGASQLAKYVPGNIFQFAGRQVMGMSIGLPAWMLLKSTIWELALLCLSGTVLSSLALPYLISITPSFSLLLTIFLIILVYIITKIILNNFAAMAYLLITFFLTITGVIFALLITTLNESINLDYNKLPPLAGAYIIAWLIGLITPGAPAGVGVREVILLFLLKNKISEQDLIFVVLIGRIVTVGGDVLIYFIANILNLIKYKGKNDAL